MNEFKNGIIYKKYNEYTDDSPSPVIVETRTPSLPAYIPVPVLPTGGLLAPEANKLTLFLKAQFC